jgi:hypothetical protein
MERFKKFERFRLMKMLVEGSKGLHSIVFKVCCSEETTSNVIHCEFLYM